jgi:hypothetical protein
VAIDDPAPNLNAVSPAPDVTPVSPGSAVMPAAGELPFTGSSAGGLLLAAGVTLLLGGLAIAFGSSEEAAATED